MKKTVYKRKLAQARRREELLLQKIDKLNGYIVGMMEDGGGFIGHSVSDRQSLKDQTSHEEKVGSLEDWRLRHLSEESFLKDRLEQIRCHSNSFLERFGSK